MNDSQRYGAPQYAGMVSRERLLRVLECSTTEMVVIAAPAGYGKTVLASQMAPSLGTATVWLSLRGASVDATRLVRLILQSVQGSACCGASSTQCVDCASCSHWQPERIGSVDLGTVVLDDVGPTTMPSDIQLALSRLAAMGRPAASCIVTTRADAPNWIAEMQPDLHLGAESLALSVQEMGFLMDSVLGRSVAQDEAARVYELSRGHAATAAVLARQLDHEPSGSGAAGLDLTAHLTTLARSQLGMNEIECLCLLALLGCATTTQLAAILGREVQAEMRGVASRIPLVQRQASGCPETYYIHGIAAAVYASREFLGLSGLDDGSMLAAALHSLDEVADYRRIFELAETHGDSAFAEQVLLLYGEKMLAIGGLDVLKPMLETIPARRTLLKPRILLLHVDVLREQMRFDEALSKAAVVRDLAEIDQDEDLLADALMILARLQIDAGLTSDAVASLSRLLEIPDCQPETSALASAYLAVCYGFVGDRGSAETYARQATSALRKQQVTGETRIRVVTSLATPMVLVDGAWSEALDQLMRVRDMEGISAALRIQTSGNIGCALVELGRAERGATMLEDAIGSAASLGLRMLELSFMDSLALARAIRCDYRTAASLMETAVSGCTETADRMALSRQYSYSAMLCRAEGRIDDSLRYSERAIEEASSLQSPWLRWMGGLELAASLLAFDDVSAAQRQAQRIHDECSVSAAGRYAFTADLVLCVIEAMRNHPHDAVARIRCHAESIERGDGNFLLIMYSRAFPVLLALLAEAELLSIVVSQAMPEITVMAARTSCRELGLPIAAQALRARFRPHRPAGCGSICTVRLFGGLDVRVGDRIVREHDWRKRKARVLFALMVLQGGRDLSREQICDLLWPELDAIKARNNFYVIWSIMKGALVPDAPRGAKLEYADNTGGRCRIDVELVSSDVEEFSRTIAAARAAENSGNQVEALACYERLREIYRGDLLPGDLYDECFSAARDRYRMQFCEAMRRAVECAEVAGRSDDSLRFARAGLDCDPLSEDLYRAVMRYHIDAGQRSAAIDAYFACRQRLCDDLGLDPSSETMRLYDQVLCMEGEDAEPAGPQDGSQLD